MKWIKRLKYKIEDWLHLPFMYSKFHKQYRFDKFKMLDIGCGSDSAKVAKIWFPNCEYYGVDKQDYNNSKEALDSIDKFYDIDLESENALDIVPDDFFDVVIISHVIEHISNGLEIVEKACKKLKTGGAIFVEWPSIRMCNNPSMAGTLNFCDDPSHKKLYPIENVANAIISGGCFIKEAKTRFYFRGLLMMFKYLFEVLRKKRIMQGGYFWDLMRISDYIYAVKK